ncbi:hypothetical protein B0T26DRAFT_764286 [Lasiosphaeria miniovina]|uniref:2EXR domain-containing protein n=1 Tax=Lasiosphaeria miniovina TaxID=1954250 RepID=A0AA40E7J0_9PEZI|nr:uncharacterized protein B0T26DRAFT_764286 [Lasiosphaeria miniovina]KAK0726906.1 hypothetical protein B0T26DRAFT_764286 [Lasiosphaeria miniovina]
MFPVYSCAFVAFFIVALTVASAIVFIASAIVFIVFIVFIVCITDSALVCEDRMLVIPRCAADNRRGDKELVSGRPHLLRDEPSFPIFGHFPAEIRCNIWAQAVEPRVLRINLHTQTEVDGGAPTPAPRNAIHTLPVITATPALTRTLRAALNVSLACIEANMEMRRASPDTMSLLLPGARRTVQVPYCRRRDIICFDPCPPPQPPFPVGVLGIDVGPISPKEAVIAVNAAIYFRCRRLHLVHGGLDFAAPETTTIWEIRSPLHTDSNSIAYVHNGQVDVVEQQPLHYEDKIFDPSVSIKMRLFIFHKVFKWSYIGPKKAKTARLGMGQLGM